MDFDQSPTAAHTGRAGEVDRDRRDDDAELGTPLILVVDDDAQNVRLLQALLRSRSYPSVAATSGRQALAEIERLMPDIVLLDVMMPDINGMEVCRAIKTSPVTRHIAVVMVTGLASRQDRVTAMEVGADDFLSKPFDQAQLTLRIRSLWRMKSYHAGLTKSRRELLAAKETLRELNCFDRGLLSAITRDLQGPLEAVEANLCALGAGGAEVASAVGGLETLKSLVKDLEALSAIRDPLGG